MTRFPSLTTATLLLLSVAATAADTGPFSVETDGGNDVLAPLAPVPIEQANSVAASRSLASCTNIEQGKFKVEGSSGKKTCGKWAQKKKCNSTVKKESFKVFEVCGKSCVTNTETGKFKVKGSSGKKTCAKWANNKKCDKKCLFSSLDILSF